MRSVKQGSLADLHGGIKPEHCLLSINGISMTGFKDAVSARLALWSTQVNEVIKAKCLNIEFSVSQHELM